jgi:outer membrane protein assembly factor BamE (lipoprotein component of BamABCDE complex)
MPSRAPSTRLREGMAKSEVEAIMGSPSTTASVNLQGDSYYYISSVTTQRSFLDPQEQTARSSPSALTAMTRSHQRRAVWP